MDGSNGLTERLQLINVYRTCRLTRSSLAILPESSKTPHAIRMQRIPAVLRPRLQETKQQGCSAAAVTSGHGRIDLPTEESRCFGDLAFRFL
jgi:hypothetical protein